MLLVKNSMHKPALVGGKCVSCGLQECREVLALSHLICRKPHKAQTHRAARCQHANDHKRTHGHVCLEQCEMLVYLCICQRNYSVGTQRRGLSCFCSIFRFH